MKGNSGVELPDQSWGRVPERDLIPSAKRRAQTNEAADGSYILVAGF